MTLPTPPVSDRHAETKLSSKEAWVAPKLQIIAAREAENNANGNIATFDGTLYS